jgi:NAD-dependent DNA ligase
MRYEIADQRRVDHNMAKFDPELTALAEVMNVMGATEGSLYLRKMNYSKPANIVITGHLSVTRGNVEKLIVEAGGVLQKQITSDTDFLVTNQNFTNVKDGASNKLRKARQYGIKIISERELYEMITTSEKEESK